MVLNGEAEVLLSLMLMLDALTCRLEFLETSSIADGKKLLGTPKAL